MTMIASIVYWIGLGLIAIVLWVLFLFGRVVLRYRTLRTSFASVPSLSGFGKLPFMALFQPEGLDNLLDAIVDRNGNVKDLVFCGSYLDGTPWLLVSNPEDIKTILASDVEFEKLPLAYDSLKIILGEGLVTSAGDVWKRQRRVITPIFHFANLRNMSPIMARNSAAWVEDIRELNGKSVEPFPLMSAVAMRTIIDCAFGHGELDPKVIHRLMTVATKQLDKYFLVSLLVGKYWANKIPLPWTNKIKSSIGEARQMILELIHRRRRAVQEIKKKQLEDDNDGEEVQHPSDLLTALLLAGDGEYEMSESLLIDESLTFLFAGHDTTSNLLSWCLYFLTRNPRVIEKLRAEIIEVLGDENEPAGIRSPTHDDLPMLRYCKNTLNEALRMRPPVPLVDRVNTNDCTFQGVHIPRGTYVFPYLIAAQHDARQWENPMEFRPERFESNNAPNGERRHAYSFTPFSAGPRNCVGQKFAMISATTMLLHIVHYFDISADLNEVVHCKFVGTATPLGFHCSFTPRKFN